MIGVAKNGDEMMKKKTIQAYMQFLTQTKKIVLRDTAKEETKNGEHLIKVG
jgi:hypothetical protein